MLFKSKKVIGLDIGSSAIKMAEVDVTRRGAVLNSFVMSPAPPNAIAGGEILEPSSISEAVAMLAQEIKTKRRNVATGLWGNSVIVKKISIPRMDEKLVGEQIRWEAEQYIPFDVNEVNLEYKVLKNVSHSPESMDILLVAARHDAVYKMVEIVEGSGLSCSILDLGGFALANTFEQNYGVINGQVVAILNLGASVTNFVVVENGEVIFCRDIPVGGHTYTNELQKGMGISSDEAESMKLSAAEGQPAPDEVNSIVHATHEIVADEIHGSIDFFMNTTHSHSISQCFVTGGASRTPGLIEQLARSANIACDIFDPFASLKWNPKNLNAEYLAQVRDFAAISVGLGLRSLGDE